MPGQHVALDQQIANLEANIRLVEERKSEYVESTAIPLDLIRQERVLRAQLQELRAAHARLRSAPCPYRGLEVFHEEHAPYFFGRTEMVNQLVNKVRLVSLVAVVGVSGSGKSSLVRAGLLPALRAGALPDSATWQIRVQRPGADPLTSLCSTLTSWLRPELADMEAMAATRRLADGLLAGEFTVGRDVLPQLAQGGQGARTCLLVIDQFEEIYDPRVDAQIRKVFVQSIAEAGAANWFKVVITLRANYFDALLQEPQLSNQVVAGQVTVLPMNQGERRDAIMLPAVKAGRAFEPGLVDRILEDLEQAAGELPLLEFAMTQLWDNQTANGVLTHAAYEEIGTVRGAIGRHASEVYAGATAEQQKLIEQLCKRLVRIDTDEVQAERLIAEANVRRVELDDLDPATQEVIRAVLAQQRLVIVGRSDSTQAETVELVHEALIRSWPALGQWLVADAPNLRVQQRLAEAVQIWERFGRPNDLLYSGGRLEEITAWRREHDAVPTAKETEFIDLSVAARRKQRLWWATGAALLAVVIGGLLAAAVIGYLPEQPAAMPADHFNIGVTPFQVGDTSGTDAQTADVLRRDAESFARGIAQQLATQTETLKADVFLDDVMVWGPGQLEIAATQPVSVAQEMRDKNVNVLISGQLAKGPGRYWSVQPYYYVSDAVFSDRAGELLAGGELHLGSPLSYIAGNQQSIREIEQQLAARLQIVGRFWQGLTQYDLGTEDGYRQASELFCGEEARSGATLPQGSDLLFLFCGHSNQMLAGMAGRANAEFERLSAAAEAAYRAGLAIAPANARLQTSLAAVLLERGKPGVLDCAQAVEAPIVAALGQAEAVLASGKLQSNMLFTTLMEAHNLVGQAHFWLGFCFDPAAAGEHWEEAERQYRAALRLRQNPLPNLRYGLRTAADAGFLLGNLNLVRYYNSTVNPPLIEQHRIDSLAAFSDSITYNLEIGDAEATNRAVDAATSAIFLLCLSNDPDQVGTILARFEGQSISPQQVVERIENAFSPDLRKGCGL